MASLTVHQVPPGSVLLLSGVMLDPDTNVVDEVARAVGHDQFCIIIADPDSATAEVWGPDTDLAAKVRDLLNGAATEL